MTMARGVRSSRDSGRPAPIADAPIPPASSGSGSRPRTPTRTTTAARSRSVRTASSTSRWATAGPPMIPCRPVKTRATGSARSCGSTSIILRTAEPTASPTDNPARRDREVRPLGARGLLHRAAERLEIQLRPQDRVICGPATSDRTSGRWSTASRTAGTTAGASARASTPFQPQRRQRPDPAGPVRPPIVEYPHSPTSERPDSGLSITGGYVYRGKKIPELVGVYVYGDFETGRIWGLRYEDGKVTANGELIEVTPRSKLNIASFGEDAAGRALHPGVRRPDPRARARGPSARR